MSSKISWIVFDLPRYHGLEGFEPILEWNCKKEELFDIFRSNHAESEW